ncbi:MAG: permease [Myxococcales bacterium]|nr:permease [Myxococcales bacterium]
MALVVFIALASIALGAVLGLWPGGTSRAASPFRAFAMVTAVAVVLGQLLPESLSALGLVALGVFALGFAAPRVIERGAFVLTKRPACEHDEREAMCTDLGLEVGYLGLLLHRVGDGIGLGLYGGPLHADHGHYDVILAIAGHTVPVTALVILAFKTHRGTGSAAFRAVGVALSTLLGIGVAGAFEPATLSAIEPWLTALVGGLLLHIVTHGWPRETAPNLMSRLSDVAAIGVGLAIVTLGGHSHAGERGFPDMRHELGHALWELGLETAPMLLLGLLVAAALQTQGSRIPDRWLRGGRPGGQALRGAVMGMPLPVCACGILPVAHSLRERGAAPALVVAFLLSTPELGVETFALTVRFLGWPFALLRLAGALLVAVVAALLLARFASASAQLEPVAASCGAGCDSDCPFGSGEPRPLPAQILGHFDDLLYHIGAWTLLGLLAAAYVQAALSEEALAGIGQSGLDVLVISALAIPSYVCASSATPLAAVLLAKGVSPGAVLAGLLLGPATNLATVAWLRKSFGAHATKWALGGLIGAAWLMAGIVNLGLPEAMIGVPELAEHEHGMVSLLSAGMLSLLFVRGVWRNGLQAWLGSLGEALAVDEGAEAAEHDHAHAHGHAHGHHHGH